MTRWEYKLLYISHLESPSFVQHQLNELGQDNWELCHVVQVDSNLARLWVFKRKMVWVDEESK